MIDVEKVRADTPGCEHVIHFNNAGASLMPQPVVDAVMDYIQLESQMGGYEAAAYHAHEIEDIYNSVAILLGCDASEIALIENATRAWDMAFYSIDFQPGDRILTTISEYASNYIPMLHIAEQNNIQIDIIPNDAHGQVSIDALKNMMDERVRLVSITHMPTNGGLVNPAEEVGEVLQNTNALFLLDACQTVGQMPIDVQAIGCDMLSATSRKYIRGPRGAGFLYVNRAILDQLHPPFIDMRAATWTSLESYSLRPDAQRFETWEASIATQLGMKTAIDYALNLGLGDIWQRIQSLATTLRHQLSPVSGCQVMDQGVVKGGIVSIQIEGKSPTEVKEYLAQHSINTTVTTRTSTRIDMEQRNLSDLLRISVHYYNTEEEIDILCTLLDEMA